MNVYSVILLSLVANAANPAVLLDVRTAAAASGVHVTPCIENQGPAGVFAYEVEVKKAGASRSRSVQRGSVSVGAGERFCGFAASTISLGRADRVLIVMKAYQAGVLVQEKVLTIPRD
jgi:hypothetical protein